MAEWPKRTDSAQGFPRRRSKVTLNQGVAIWEGLELCEGADIDLANLISFDGYSILGPGLRWVP